MATAEILEGIHAEQDKQRDAYWQAVRTIAKGKQPDMATLSAALLVIGKSDDDLTRDVEVIVDRNRKREQLAAANGTAETIAKLRAEIDRLEAAHQKNVKAHQEQVAPLIFQINTAKEKQTRAPSKSELIQTCPDDRLHERAEQLRHALHAASEATKRARADHDRLETAAANAQDKDREWEIEQAVERAKQRLTEAVTEEQLVLEQSNDLAQQMADF